jgi:hypothetical protein
MGEWADEAINSIIDREFFSRRQNRQRKQETKEARIVLIRGKAKWAKIIGEPVWGYENKHKEWSIDVYPEDESIERLKAEGLGEKLKDKGNGLYITFKRRDTKQDGTPTQPIRVVDHHGQAWDPKQRIGNGSVVNVNFAINEYGKNQKSANILSLQVWDLVKYEGSEFPTKEEDASWEAEVA